MTSNASLAPSRFARYAASPRGFRQSYVREGSGGRPLALLHGWPETSRIWWRVLEPLAAAGFDVVAPDLRGFGESDVAPDGCGDVPAHSADLYALLHEELGFARVILAAGDLGGVVAQDLALRFPGFVERLVLWNTPLPGPAGEATDLGAGLAAYASALGAPGRGAPISFGGNPTPALLLFTASDPGVPPDLDARAARAFPNRAGPLPVRDAGRFLPWEAPDALCDAIRQHCRPDPAPASGEQVAYVSLGSNLGSREHHLGAAFAALRGSPDVHDVVASRTYETDPVGPGKQGAYLNAVARLRTGLAPRALLEELLAIERERGRERGAERNAPRTLDLDLLLYGARTIDEPELQVPHPRLSERSFVLEPLCDLAPDLVPPGGSRCVAELAAATRDPARVRRRDR